MAELRVGEVKKVMHLRWVIWWALGLAFALNYFNKVAPAVVADNLVREFHLGGAVILGSLASTYFYVYAFMQIPAGILADSIGPRRSSTYGLLIAALGSTMFGLAPTLFFVYLGRLLIGLGLSVIVVNMMKVQAEWFRVREFSTMTGMMAFVGNFGTILGATPLAMLVAGIGWRWSFVSIGLVTAIIGILCWLLVRNRPAEMGLPSLPAIEAWEGRLETSPPIASTRPALGQCIRTTLANRRIWPAFIVLFGMYGTLLSFIGMWGVPYVSQVYGLERFVAARFMMAAAIGLMLGGPLVGAISDRLACRKMPLVVTALVYLLLWVALIFWNGGKPPLGMLYLIFFGFGVFGGAFILTYTCAKEVNPPGIAGLTTGTINTGGFLGAAILEPLLGYILDLNWQGQMVGGMKIYPVEAFQSAFSVSLGVMVLAFVASLFITETGGRNIYCHLTATRRATDLADNFKAVRKRV